MPELTHDEAKTQALNTTHYDANGQPIQVGSVHWDNNLELVIITQIAAHMEYDYRSPTHWTPWHAAVRASDAKGGGTYDGGTYGRLATYHPMTGQRAEDAARAAGHIH